MKGKLAITIIVVLCLSLFSGFAPKVNGQESTVDWWSTFHHDPARSGYSASPSILSNKTLWVFQANGAFSSSPAVVNGLVYVGSFDGDIYALNAATGSILWSYNTNDQAVESSPTVYEGAVYFSSDDNNLYAFNAASGNKIWSYKSTGGFGSPALANKLVYVTSSDGNVYAFNAAKGTKTWNYTMGANSAFSPAVSNGVVYAVSYYGNVYALDAAKGTKIWNYATDNFAACTPSVGNGLVYFGTGDSMYALNASTGTLVWNYTLGLFRSVNSSPAIANNIVYFGGGLGAYALNATTGSLVWSWLQGVVRSSPAIANGVVYFGSTNGNFYALNAETGAFMWSYETTGKNTAIVSSPAVANGVVYVGVSSDSQIDDNVVAFGSIAVPQPSPTIPEFQMPLVVPIVLAITTVVGVCYKKSKSRRDSSSDEKLPSSGCSLQKHQCLEENNAKK